MGGGARYPYPKWVWSWFGGWWAEPANATKNALVSVGIYSVALAAMWSYSASIETRHHYPNRWIPSMLWGRDFYDPAFVAQWKKQLKATGKEWIDN